MVNSGLPNHMKADPRMHYYHMKVELGLPNIMIVDSWMPKHVISNPGLANHITFDHRLLTI